MAEYSTGNSTISCGMVRPVSITYAVLVSVEGMFSLPSNVWVVLLMLRGKGGSITSDLFTFNLASLELCICVVTFLSVLCLFIPLTQPVIFIFNFFFGFIVAGRPLSQSCICLERYMAVVHPIKFLKYKTIKYKLPLLTVVWLFILCFCACYHIIYSTYSFNVIFVSCLAIDSFCSISILRVLRQPRPGGGEREEMNLTKKRAFTTVLVIQTVLMVNYLPMAFASMAAPFYPYTYSECVVFPAAFCFTACGNFIHPLLYLSRAQQFPCRNI